MNTGMNTVILLALAAALFIGLGLALTQMGMRHLSPLRGACVSIPTTALFFLLLAPMTIDFGAGDQSWRRCCDQRIRQVARRGEGGGTKSER